MSAIIGGLIPKIEGFQPIPNAVMIPFMEVQSAALAYGFGLNYEFSKRKIRSMSNEQFNALTPQAIEEMQARHTAVLLEGFIKRVPQVMPAQAQIFTQYVAIEKLKVKQNFELAKWMVQFAKEFIDDETAHLLGGHIHPSGISPTETQTYYDPNNPDKDFKPPTKSTSTIAPRVIDTSNVPKYMVIDGKQTNIPVATATARVSEKLPLTSDQEYTAWNKELTTIALKTQEMKSQAQSYRNNNVIIYKVGSAIRNDREKQYKILLKRHAAQQRVMAQFISLSRNNRNARIKSAASKYYSTSFWTKF